MSSDRNREAGDLDGLFSEAPPLAGLEDSLVEEFTHAGLLESGGARWRRRTARALVVLVTFLAGFGLARGSAPDADLADYALLLWAGDGFVEGDASAVAVEYGRWASEHDAGGVRISGAELGSPEAVGAPSGPITRAELGGFFLLSGVDREGAMRLARGHPHLGRGGWIEVRPLR